MSRFLSLKHWILAKLFVNPQQYLPCSTTCAKLSRSLQAKNIDLITIAPHADATLNTLDDVVLPAATWVLKLLNTKDDLEAASDIS